MSVIKTVAWAYLAWNTFGLIGASTIIKSLLNNKVFWLRAVTDPDKTKKDASYMGKKTAKFALGAIVSVIALVLIYSR